MAFKVQRTIATKGVFKRETTQGTEPDPAPAGGTNDIICYTNADIMGMSLSKIRTNPYTGSMTKRRGFNGPYRVPVNLEFNAMGSGTAGTEGVNGFAAQSAVYCAAGHSLAVTASTSLVYKPATVALLTTFGTSTPFSGSMTGYVERDGQLHKANGIFGGLRFRGNPSSGCVAQFQGSGLYVAPAAGSISGYVGGTRRDLPFINVTAALARCEFPALGSPGTISSATAANPAVFTGSATTNLTAGDYITIWGATGNWTPINGLFKVATTPSGTTFTIREIMNDGIIDSSTYGALTGTVQYYGGTPYSFTGLNMDFNTGGQTSEVTAFTSATGLQQILFADRNPSLELTMAADNDTSTLTYSEFFSDAIANYDLMGHVRFGSVAGNRMFFDFPFLNATDVRPGNTNGFNTLTVPFDVWSENAQGEYRFGFY